MLKIVCWKWHDPGYRWNRMVRYGPEHVNRLARAVRENLALPHEFVCLTDDDAGIERDLVTVLPVPTRYAEMGMCYRRLWLFSREAREALGRRLVQIDLDCVVTGDLTPLFDRAEDFVVWRTGFSDWRNPDIYCASLLMMTAGAYPHVWDNFDPVEARAVSKRIVGSDQAWFTHVLGPDMPVWTADDGVLSYRRHFHGGALPGRRTRLGKSLEPPANCRIVFFHGPFDPSLPGIHTVFPWIGDYWRHGHVWHSIKEAA